jgi:hypothetical protein
MNPVVDGGRRWLRSPWAAVLLAAMLLVGAASSPWPKSILGLWPPETLRFSRELRSRHRIPPVQQAVCPQPASAGIARAEETGAADDGAALTARIGRFCGDCHALPRPESYRAADWHGRIRLAYEFHARSGRVDLDPPPIAAVTRWYVERAPARLPVPARLPAAAPAAAPAVAPAATLPAAAAPVAFRVERIASPAGGMAPGTADLRWATLATGPRLVVCDMLRGEVVAFDPRATARAAEPLAALRHPCRVEPVVGTDGRTELLVADLGSTDGFDHALGQAVRLALADDGSRWHSTSLIGGLGRVADVQPWDDDLGPGVVVAEFGYQRTGSLLLVRPPTVDGAGPAPRRLDERSGAIAALRTDLDGDGRRDIVALFGQEHETVTAFLDRGGGRFERRTLWRGDDLAIGSSSIDLADVDGDGDDDILLTHGDAFDNRLVTPWHGVQWLERGDGLAFEPQWLADLPGAYRARAADLDRDGDTDLVVATWLPADTDPGTLPTGPVPSLVLFEGLGGGRFAPHVLETDRHTHPALELADFDGDGDVDLAVGTHAAGLGADGSRLTLWWNRSRGD